MINIAFFSTKSYDQDAFEQGKSDYDVQYHFYDFLLNEQTAKMAKGCEVVCAFVNDDLSRPVLEQLAARDVKMIAMRCAGFNNVDLDAAKELGIQVARVPGYSPEAIAEHAVGLMMTLNRRFHKAYQRTRDANFSLEGLVGFNFFGRTAGIIGTGKIGCATIRILKGLGMNVLCYDPYPNDFVVEAGATYCDLDTLIQQSDVISLHCPMTPENYHLLDATAFGKMKDGVMIINTSRGELVDSIAAIDALKAGRIGALGLDVYESEKELFFHDKSNDVIVDDVFRRLSSCHNVLFTGHQAFLTRDALSSIASTTLANIENFKQQKTDANFL
ncbi:D-lactate dehydrogenase [Vibrio halioticoli NBRC 102217]|uniref:D-lactate dehydrogenase n=1 Tax=Vibrio halioticoli NBRC 102217 TaxID=1219072 RepID=V5FDA1_9VIBR|nr:2-hydroxyacid dehydrogenase [Vibrio halioticoli]GAD89553.1 D-lactate dehydrogenase [Vibrio halioticoli NBRC 102217]